MGVLHANQTTISYGGNTVATLDSIGSMKLTAGKIPITGLTDTFVKNMQDICEIGDVAIKGKFITTDTNGQIQMVTDIKTKVASGSEKEIIITLPGSVATLTFNGFLTDVEVGPFENKEIAFAATICPTTMPVLALTAVTGMSAIAFDNDVLVMPTFAIGRYGKDNPYVVTITAGQTATVVTPTDATSGEIITIETDGAASQVVPTGQPSTACVLDVDDVTQIKVTISKPGYISKEYYFNCAVLAA
jgi:hypothetical protein